MRTLFGRVAQANGGFSRASLVAVATWVIGTLGVAQAQAAETIYLKPSVGTITYKNQTENLVASGVNGCVLNTASLTLLTIAGTGSPAGVPGWNSRDKVIGVNGGSAGSPCTQVRIGQGVKVGPGSQFPFAKTKVTNATIALRASPKATIRVQTYNGATLVHDRDNLVCSKDCSYVLDGTNDLDTTTTQAKQWDYVVITSKTGNTSSESGAFSLRDSQFTVDLVPEGTLACGDRTADVDVAVDDNPNEPNILRLPDEVLPSGPCVPLPFNLSFADKTLEFLANYSVLVAGTEPAFVIPIVWDPELVTVPAGIKSTLKGAVNPPASTNTGVFGTVLQSIPLSTIQFLGTDATYLSDFCPGKPIFDANGEFVRLDLKAFDDAANEPPLPTVNANDMSTYPGFQFGCLLERRVEVLNFYDGETNPGVDPLDPPVVDACQVSADVLQLANTVCIRVTERIYVRGDVILTRKY